MLHFDVESTDSDTITNCYYMNPQVGSPASVCTVSGAKQAYSITAGTDVTVANAGAVSNTYNFSGLTFYAKGFKYDDVLYAGDGDYVSLTLGDSREGYFADGYEASDGTLSGSANPYTLTMPAEGVTIDATSWFQELHPDGNGDYLIASTANWESFCAIVNHNLNNFNGETVKLTANISVSTMVGTSETNSFQGTFIGGGNTITATITDNSSQGTALFHYINGATIQNLIVGGTVTSSQYHAAGLVGFSAGTGNSIENCLVTTTVNGSGYVGGLVGHAGSSDITITGCAYSGRMNGGSNNTGALIGWGDSGTRTLTNCLYIVADGQSTTNLDLVKGGGSLTMTNCTRTVGGRTITAGEYVTIEAIDPVGNSTVTYSVSGITAYTTGGIVYDENFYYGQGNQLNLTFSGTIPGSAEPTYFVITGTLTGTENPYTLTMPDA